MRTALQRLALSGAVMIALGMVWAAAQSPMTVAGIRTSRQSRATYLGRATIWQDPGTLSPTDLFEGPSGAFPYTFEQANSDDGIGCTFTRAGQELSGNSPKFLCRTADGHDLRLKYLGSGVSDGQPRSVRDRRGHAPVVGARIRSNTYAASQRAL